MPDSRIPLPQLPTYQEHPGDPKPDFREWLSRFKTYLELLDVGRDAASRLTNSQKNNLLLLYLGTEAGRTFGTHPRAREASTASASDFQEAVLSFFAPPRSFIRAGYDLFHRRQGPDETVDEFLCALRVIIPDVDLADPSKLLTIQLVAGCNDINMQKELLAMVDPTLERVLEKMRAIEAAKRDAQSMGPPLSLGRTQQSRSSKPTKSTSARNQRPPPQTSATTQSCMACGSQAHIRQQCPHRDKVCNHCKIKGHIQAACRKKRIGNPAVREVCDTAPVHSMDASISQIGRPPPPLMASLHVSNGSLWVPVTMEVDTGAAPTTLTEDFYQKHLSQLPLQPPPTETIRNFDGTPIAGIKGSVKTKLALKDRFHQGNILIVKRGLASVLGRDFLEALCISLDLGSRQISTMDTKVSLSDFPKLTDPSLGTFPNYAHRIRIQDGAIPKVTRCRPVPLHRRQAVYKEIKDMDEAGIWERVTTSQWAHPLVSVPKADQGVRITSDLSALNKYVIPERYPLPHIKDLFLEMAGSKIFSKLDLKKGFYHIQLNSDSRDLTTTITPLGLRRYCRLPMGLTDSSAIFQRLIHQILSGCDGCIVYVDDIIIHAATPEEHNHHLRKVLQTLTKHDLRLQQKKCLFLQNEIPAFGHIISSTGIRPDPVNLKPIKDAPRPQNLKDVQSFLGLINYFQDFIQDLSSIAEPLRNLTRKDVPFIWTEDCECAFQVFKKLALEDMALHIYDPNAPTLVTTDASDIGIGGLLTQMQQGKEIPIAFFNRTLSSPERNYAANEKEALACVMALEHWEKLLLGRPFTLRTDHQALQTLLASPISKRQSSKFLHWKERLAAFDYHVEYLPGPLNQAADALSRLHQRASDLGIQGIKAQGLKEMSAADRDIKEIQNQMQLGWQNYPPELRPYFNVRDQLKWSQGLLWFKNKILPPASAHRDILKFAHEGHPGIVRMKRILRDSYWWPGMSKRAEQFVNNCLPCQVSSKSRGTQAIPSPSIPRADKPAAQWALDITGPFWNNRYLVVAMDSYSSFPEILDTKETTTNIIIEWLSDLFARYGLPQGILTDNGPQFVSSAFQNFLKEADIHHYTSAVYNPQENGQVEAFNKFLKHGIQAFHSTNQSWKCGLRQLLAAYRATPPSTDVPSPAFRFLNHTFRAPHQPNLTQPQRRTLHTSEAKEVGSSPSRPLWTGRSLYKKGENVLTKKPHVPKGHSPWSEPKVIEQVLGYYTYKLSDGQVWNARKIKPFRITTTRQSPDQAPGQTPPPQPPQLRRSTRANQGLQPERYDPCNKLEEG